MATSIDYMGYRGVWWPKIQITLGPNPIPKPRNTLRPTFIPAECLTQMTLLQIVTDDENYGEVLVFEDCDSFRSPDPPHQTYLDKTIDSF